MGNAPKPTPKQMRNEEERDKILGQLETLEAKQRNFQELTPKERADLTIGRQIRLQREGPRHQKYAQKDSHHTVNEPIKYNEKRREYKGKPFPEMKPAPEATPVR